MAGQANQIAYGTNSPSALGDLNYWQLGDIVINNAPGPNVQQVWGWLCTVAGTPGTWQALFTDPTITNTTTATSGTLTNGIRFQLINPATTGTYSLPAAQVNAAGSLATFKNIASGSVTLTPIASNGYADAAAITLAQFASVTLFGNGSTTWYRQQ